MRLTHHPNDSFGRAVLSGSCENLEVLARELRSPVTPFVLVLAGDTSSVPGAEIVDVAMTLIRSGAHYVCCWGLGCARLHDCFDEAAVALTLANTENDVHVMTTWHDGDPLEEALWFALNCAIPAVDDEPPTRAVVAIAVGNEAVSTRISAYLAAGAPIRDEA